jgi:hypothetical protein
VFENRALRRIFGPERDEVTAGCSKLRNKELHSVYFSPNRPIIMLIKSRRMRWTGLVECMRQIRNGYTILIAKLPGSSALGNPGIDGRTILERILEKRGVDWIKLS